MSIDTPSVDAIARVLMGPANAPGIPQVEQTGASGLQVPIAGADRNLIGALRQCLALCMPRGVNNLNANTPVAADGAEHTILQLDPNHFIKPALDIGPSAALPNGWAVLWGFTVDYFCGATPPSLVQARIDFLTPGGVAFTSFMSGITANQNQNITFTWLDFGDWAGTPPFPIASLLVKTFGQAITVNQAVMWAQALYPMPTNNAGVF